MEWCAHEPYHQIDSDGYHYTRCRRCPALAAWSPDHPGGGFPELGRWLIRHPVPPAASFSSDGISGPEDSSGPDISWHWLVAFGLGLMGLAGVVVGLDATMEARAVTRQNQEVLKRVDICAAVAESGEELRRCLEVVR